MRRIILIAVLTICLSPTAQAQVMIQRMEALETRVETQQHATPPSKVVETELVNRINTLEIANAHLTERLDAQQLDIERLTQALMDWRAQTESASPTERTLVASAPRQEEQGNFQDFPDGPEMVVIPGGSFLMGSPEDEDNRESDEGPQTRMTMTSFALGKYEVTFDEYDACVDAGACRSVSGGSGGDRGWGRGRRPVINVHVVDAERYILWLNSQIDGFPYRLPSEAEWEYAARAGTTTRYYWGWSFSKDHANGDGTDGQDQFRHTAPVGSFPANDFGLYDMIGNVREWTADCWSSSYTRRPTTNAPLQEGDCNGRVIRGASWDSSKRYLRSAYRNWSSDTSRRSTIGFRVARALP